VSPTERRHHWRSTLGRGGEGLWRVARGLWIPKRLIPLPRFLQRSSRRRDRQAERAGGSIVKKPAVVPNGYFGHFSDPDGYLWKVATGG